MTGKIPQNLPSNFMKKISELKIAVFYDWLNQWGGAERLLLDILKVFPQAKLFTSVYSPLKTPWLPKDTKITTTFLDKFSIFKSNSFLSALFQPIAFEQFNFDNFDLVISLTSLQGKCLLTKPHILHICFCLTPNRYLYQKRYPSLIQYFINSYKKIDYIYSQRPDYYISTSKTVKKRILKHYHRHSTTIYPGVDTNLFKPSIKKNMSTERHDFAPDFGNYFLIVSRLVPHKQINIAITACINTDNRLLIIGQGRLRKHLKKISGKSKLIEFVGEVSQDLLIKYYQNCTALICPQLEDYGYVALEAQACGKPVIAYGKGGFSETVIDGKTGLLFPEQSVSSLTQALKIFPKNNFSASDCRANASRFSRTKFMLNFKRIIHSLWQKKQPNTTL